MKGRLAKGIAQVLTLALVVGGLVAFVVTQRGAEAASGAVTASDTSSEGFDLAGSVLAMDRASQVTVDLPEVVTVSSAGYERSFATRAATVEEALSAADIKFDDNDIITPARDTKITEDLAVTIKHVEVTTRTTTEALPYSTVEVEDEDLLEGKTTVLSAGAAGERATTWTITTVDGEETKREATSTKTVREPSERRVAIGTKEPAPEPTPAPSRSSSSTSSSSSTQASAPSQASAPTSGVWQALAQCESGGNWSINTGNGYYGGLQFSASSWAGAGGTQYAPLPHLATPAEQIATAEVLRSNGGWGHWPACSSQLGLR